MIYSKENRLWFLSTIFLNKTLKYLNFENSQLFFDMKTWFNVQREGSFVQKNDKTMHTLAPMHSSGMLLNSTISFTLDAI